MVNFKEFYNYWVWRKLNRPYYTSKEPRKCLLTIPEAFSIKIGLFDSRSKWRDEALAEGQRKNIPEYVEIVFESACVPVDGTRIGTSSVYIEYKHLSFKDEEIRLLKYIVRENGTFEVSMISY